MACGCNGGNGDQWVVVYADNTVSAAMSKAEATVESKKVSGSWIREAQKAAA